MPIDHARVMCLDLTVQRLLPDESSVESGRAVCVI